jgi:chaperonin GroES
MKKEKKNSSGRIVPLADRVLLKELKEEETETKTKSGIIIPVTVGEDKGSKRGRVIAVGKGRYDDGKLIPPEVSVGDIVLFGWGDKIKMDGEEYFVVRENEITAILK